MHVLFNFCQPRVLEYEAYTPVMTPCERAYTWYRIQQLGYTYASSPSESGRREIRGVTQVEQKNTQTTQSQPIWRKHGVHAAAYDAF